VIAAELGVRSRYVYELLNDPDGAKLRARHERARGVCADCGRPTSWATGGSSARCLKCASLRAHEGRVWTREAIIEAFRWFARECGRPPGAAECGGGRGFERWVDGMPHYGAVRREFGSMRAAREAAGLGHPKKGGAAHRRRPA